MFGNTNMATSESSIHRRHLVTKRENMTITNNFSKATVKDTHGNQKENWHLDLETKGKLALQTKDMWLLRTFDGRSSASSSDATWIKIKTGYHLVMKELINQSIDWSINQSINQSVTNTAFLKSPKFSFVYLQPRSCNCSRNSSSNQSERTVCLTSRGFHRFSRAWQLRMFLNPSR